MGPEGATCSPGPTQCRVRGLDTSRAPANSWDRPPSALELSSVQHVSVVIRWTGPRAANPVGLSSPGCPLLSVSLPRGELPDWSEDQMLWEKLRPPGLHVSV